MKQTQADQISGAAHHHQTKHQMSTKTIAATELTKLVGKASEAAAKAVGGEGGAAGGEGSNSGGGGTVGDAAAEERCLDVLKVLAGAQVTAALLKDTDAGKRINRLSKSSNKQIAAAAADVVQAWKACVKKQAADAGLQSTGSLPGVSSARSLSMAAADNGSEQQQEGTSQQQQQAAAPPSSQQQRQQQPAAAAAAAGGNGSGSSAASSSKPPPKAGDPKRDKVGSPCMPQRHQPVVWAGRSCVSLTAP